MGNTVTMTDKDVLIINMISCAMTGSFETLLITFDKQVATTVAHIYALAV